MKNTDTPTPDRDPRLLTSCVQGWSRFWFRPADPTTLGLVRILCGLALLYVHLAYIPDLFEFFGRDAWFDLRAANELRHEMPWIPPPDDWGLANFKALPDDPLEQARLTQHAQRWGIDPHMIYDEGNYGWSLWYHLTDPSWMVIVHTAVLGIFVLFTIGYQTRIVSVLAWLAAMCYVQRSPVSLFGQDAMMMILLLYLMIGPSGAALSLDRWLARRRGEAIPAPSTSANLAVRLMQVHFCIIYMMAGLSKLLGGTWWSGTAVWWTLANYEFAPLRLPIYYESLRWLTQHRLVWEIAMSAGVFGTLALEISFPYLVWKRELRWLMVLGSVMLHTFIAVFMGLVTFGLLMVALALSFVPPEAVHRLLEKKPQDVSRDRPGLLSRLWVRRAA
jgi:hypothetical protein